MTPVEVIDDLMRIIDARTRWLGWMNVKEERRVIRAYRYLLVRRARR